MPSRKIYDYHISYVTVAPDDLYKNNPSGYSAETRVQTLRAHLVASPTDAGYPVPFHDYYKNLVIQWYDAAPGYQGGTPKQLAIYQKPVNRKWAGS